MFRIVNLRSVWSFDRKQLVKKQLVTAFYWLVSKANMGVEAFLHLKLSVWECNEILYCRDVQEPHMIEKTRDFTI